MGKLDGKVALITGSARGQGAEIARTLAGEGARVVLGDLLDDPGREVAAAIGDTARYLHLDVTSEADWVAAVATILADLGRLDVLVNCAGVNLSLSIEETTVEDFMHVTLVNQLGPWLGIRAVAGAMRDGGGGSIVNIGSIGAFTALASKSAYLASKYGLRGISKAAAIEYGHDGIRVNTVHPGGIASDMTDGMPAATFADQPIPRIGRPEEIARAVLFFACEDSAYCTGTEIAVDGGRLISNLPTPKQPAAERGFAERPPADG